MHKTESLSHSEYFLNETAELKKQKFLEFVAALIQLRELQYERGIGKGTLARAQGVMARNLPSNLLRAAAIFVDHAYGFPGNWESFQAPEWVTAQRVLNQEQADLPACAFRQHDTYEEKDVVVLLCDLPEVGLHAGMAGIVRELPDEDDTQNEYLVEFGEPDECITIEARVSQAILRPPRPGDLLENFRL